MLDRKKNYALLAETVMKNLEKRNMEACYCDTKEEALEKACSYLSEGCSVSWGGSATLHSIGLIDYLTANEGTYTLYNRFACKTAEEKREMYAKGTLSDVYFMSSNALTKDGILVNMDGSGNRVASLAYGPNMVVLVIGMNKVTSTVEDAVHRIEMQAAPINTVHLNLDTPCTKTGTCIHCKSKSCICCNLAITRYNRVDGRIKVILVGEDLGY